MRNVRISLICTASVQWLRPKTLGASLISFFCSYLLSNSSVNAVGWIFNMYSKYQHLYLYWFIPNTIIFGLDYYKLPLNWFLFLQFFVFLFSRTPNSFVVVVYPAKMLCFLASFVARHNLVIKNKTKRCKRNVVWHTWKSPRVELIQ